MNKVYLVALREFRTTVLSRAFIFGWLLAPAFIALLLFWIPKINSPRDYRVQGEIAIVDPTGVVAPALKETVDLADMVGSRGVRSHSWLRNGMGSPPAGAVNSSPQVQALPGSPSVWTAAIKVVEDSGSDLARQKLWLARTPADGPRHLALVVIHPGAIDTAQSQGTRIAYALYVPVTTDARAENAIREMLSDAILSARVRAYGLDMARLNELLSIDVDRTVVVARDGSERLVVGSLNRMAPIAFMTFMFIAILSSGQFLLSTMVEEKSNRIIEVLLSSVSPLELLAGKILGQLAAALVGIVLYFVAAALAVLTLAPSVQIDAALLVYLVLGFVVSFLTMGSIMVGVGAAVNELREAQALLKPFTVVVGAMWVLAIPILQAPNSGFAIALSFAPVISTFAMTLRMISTAPPPLWQAGLSLVAGVAFATLAIWFAAKIFRVGLLLQGRPPDLKTLIRWATTPS
ncbi:MAG TPA: ABC transporter permease [Steroidobacteraceae bacterium]|nr:ABC transporter permease [Steroidobacteraceae bacterium]